MDKHISQCDKRQELGGITFLKLAEAKQDKWSLQKIQLKND
jgi:hypothetical protein